VTFGTHRVTSSFFLFLTPSPETPKGLKLNQFKRTCSTMKQYTPKSEQLEPENLGHYFPDKGLELRL